MLLFFPTAIMPQTGAGTEPGLSTAGWIFISFAWAAIISVAVFCYSKVIRIAEQRKRAAASSGDKM